MRLAPSAGTAGVVFRNGRFYWYVPVRQRSTGSMVIGVAVSSSPTGPFADALGRPLVGNGEIDPAVFVDDDGQAYLYRGNPRRWFVRLNAEMITLSGSPTQIPLTTQGFGARTGNPSRPTLYEEGALPGGGGFTRSVACTSSSPAEAASCST